jgi:hypothetical protein
MTRGGFRSALVALVAALGALGAAGCGKNNTAGDTNPPSKYSNRPGPSQAPATPLKQSPTTSETAGR